MRRFLLCLLLLLSSLSLALAQNADSLVVSRLFREALSRGQSYDMLTQLVAVGPRLSGSSGYDRAAAWGERTLAELLKDRPGARVFRQDVQVPHWIRGATERARILGQKGLRAEDLAVTALGGSVGTAGKPLVAEVIEVRSLDTLAKLGPALAGKIVFFNRPMEAAHPSPSAAYGRAGDQRRLGPALASKYGAVAALVRSLTHAHDDLPHTGTMSYDPATGYGSPGTQKIPAAALGAQSADRLSQALRSHPRLRLSLTLSAQQLPDVTQPNIVAELKGTQHPDQIVVIGGHLDAWDNGQGAHDDGAGCVHAIEALRLLLATGVAPKRTVRVVLFANEENGLRGAQKYAELALKDKTEKGESTVAAIESDAGGFAPRGFSVDGSPERLARLRRWAPLLHPWGAERFDAGGGGADIGPLKPQGTLLIGLKPDPHRYFDYHHTAADRLEAVNPRELALGSGAMAALLYLLSEYGVD